MIKIIFSKLLKIMISFNLSSLNSKTKISHSKKIWTTLLIPSKEINYLFKTLSKQNKLNHKKDSTNKKATFFSKCNPWKKETI
jgi:hypothetical protein